MTAGAQNKTRLFFDDRAKDWDLSGDIDNSMVRSVLDSACVWREGMCMLDAGCGTGIMFPLLLERNPKKLDAIDISPKMAEIAKKKNRDARVFVRCANLYTYCPKEKYDFIMIYNAYPHFQDKALFAEKLCDLLCGQGRFLVLHGSGRHTINQRHNGKEVSDISSVLRPAKEEAAVFEECFDIDMCIDNQDCYALSGKKK